MSTRIAAVTGGGGGLGRAIAGVLAEAGAQVALIDVDEAGMRSVAAELNGSAACFALDIASSAAVAEGFARITRELGPVDILVNNAGITDHVGPLATLADATWDREVAINLSGAFYAVRAVFPGMRERRWGRVINISSIAASLGDYGHAGYAASKAGLLGLTRSVALEGARHGVTSNAVLPGLIRTPAYEKVRPDLRERTERRAAMRRAGEPIEVASLVGYLASAHAGYITGSAIPVSGGTELFVI